MVGIPAAATLNVAIITMWMSSVAPQSASKTDTEELQLELHGARLAGRFELARLPHGLVFQPAT